MSKVEFNTQINPQSETVLSASASVKYCQFLQFLEQFFHIRRHFFYSTCSCLCRKIEICLYLRTYRMAITFIKISSIKPVLKRFKFSFINFSNTQQASNIFLFALESWISNFAFLFKFMRFHFAFSYHSVP